MSGFTGMNEFEDPFEPNRRHLKRLQRENGRARIRSNMDLARDLYQIAEGLPDSKAIRLMEAAERLSIVELTDNQTLGRN